MNKIILIGNLTRDPETRTTPNGHSVCDFTIAVNRRRRGQDGQQEADFFRVSAWDKQGEVCQRFLAKGRKVFVSGPLSARTYTANDGSTRVSLEVRADDVEFLTSRAESMAMDGAPASEQGVTAQNNGFTNVDATDEDLPF